MLPAGNKEISQLVIPKEQLCKYKELRRDFKRGNPELIQKLKEMEPRSYIPNFGLLNEDKRV